MGGRQGLSQTGMAEGVLVCRSLKGPSIISRRGRAKGYPVNTGILDLPRPPYHTLTSGRVALLPSPTPRPQMGVRSFLCEIFKHLGRKYHYLWLLEEKQDLEGVGRVTSGKTGRQLLDPWGWGVMEPVEYPGCPEGKRKRAIAIV